MLIQSHILGTKYICYNIIQFGLQSVDKHQNLKWNSAIDDIWDAFQKCSDCVSEIINNIIDSIIIRKGQKFVLLNLTIRKIGLWDLLQSKAFDFT